MSTLGVVVFSLQGMKHLAQCLESVRWADVIVVLHAGDGEPSIGADPRPAPILQKFSPKQEIRQFCQGIKTDWVLHLWGEERVEGELSEELRALCKAELPQSPLRYRIPIRSRLLGRWAEGSLWGSSPALRLSRELEGLAPGGWWHETDRRLRQGSGLLRGWIGDYSSARLGDGVDRVNLVSSLWAERLQEGSGSPTSAAMALRSLRVFVRLLFMNGVFSHGLAGLTLSALAAYATLLSGARVWEAGNVRQIAG